jgi:hypothetical protein
MGGGGSVGRGCGLVLLTACLAGAWAAQAEDAVKAPDASAASSAAKPSHVIVNAKVVAEPTPDDFVRVYPPKAWDDRIAGSAMVKCRILLSGELSDCVLLAEAPLGRGFGEAGVKLAPLYKMSPATVDGRPVESPATLDLKFPVMADAGEPPEDEAPVDHPWLACAKGTAAPKRYYPKAAQGRNVEGLATIECRALSNGETTACTWITETPPGYGFGDKAAAMGCLMRLRVVIPPGATPRPRHFKAPVRFAVAKD